MYWLLYVSYNVTLDTRNWFSLVKISSVLITCLFSNALWFCKGKVSCWVYIQYQWCIMCILTAAILRGCRAPWLVASFYMMPSHIDPRLVHHGHGHTILEGHDIWKGHKTLDLYTSMVRTILPWTWTQSLLRSGGGGYSLIGLYM